MGRDHPGRLLNFDKPAVYQIQVQGWVDESWSDRLEGMAISLEFSEARPTISTLNGMLIDQAALMGVFNTLYELHLPILSVQCLSKR